MARAPGHSTIGVVLNESLPSDPPALTERFTDAVALALEIHGHARRPGTGIPFTAHLFVVTGLVIEDGGDEDQAIAALLHDAVEDEGGRPRLVRIRSRFGERVAEIVTACSDSIDPDHGQTWSERKQRYLAHLRETQDEGILRVALADKVHNARSLVRDYREDGPLLWERFTERTPGEQLAYYGSLLSLFKVRRPGPMTEDFEHAVGELAALLAGDPRGQPELSCRSRAPADRAAAAPVRAGLPVDWPRRRGSA